MEASLSCYIFFHPSSEAGSSFQSFGWLQCEVSRLQICREWFVWRRKRAEERRSICNEKDLGKAIIR